MPRRIRIRKMLKRARKRHEALTAILSVGLLWCDSDTSIGLSLVSSKTLRRYLFDRLRNLGFADKRSLFPLNPKEQRELLYVVVRLLPRINRFVILSIWPCIECADISAIRALQTTRRARESSNKGIRHGTDDRPSEGTTRP